MNDIIPASKNFFDMAFSYPSLTDDEEKQLTSSYYYDGDVEAAKKIVLSYLKLVVRIEADLRGYGVDREEMVQEGVVGLMKAVKNFDPRMNLRVSTYASDWIRAAMLEYVMKNTGTVKAITTRAHKKVFFNINKYRDDRGIISDEAREKMSSDLGISMADVNDSIARLTTKTVGILTNEATDEDYENSGDFEFNLECENDGPEESIVNSDYEVYENKNLYKAIDTLNEREKDILIQRWLNDEKPTLEYLSVKYNVSSERIRQIEKQAMKRVRKYLEENCELVRQ